MTKITKETKEAMLECKEDLEIRLAIINDVLENGVPITEAGKKYGKGTKFIREMIKPDTTKFKKVKIRTIEGYRRFIDASKTGAERFFDTVFDTDKYIKKYQITQYPNDLEASIHYILDSPSFSDRERAIYKIRYEKNMTLEEAGKQLGVTRERIRQIEARMLRKCKWRDRAKILVLGLEQYKLLEEERDAEGKLRTAQKCNENLRTYIDDCKNQISRLSSINEQLKNTDTKEAKEALQKELEKVSGEAITLLKQSPEHGKNDMTTIKEAFPNISIRAYNCLKHAGISCVADLKKYDYYGLTHNIRNLGKKSAHEVIILLKEYDGTIIEEIPVELKGRL